MTSRLGTVPRKRDKSEAAVVAALRGKGFLVVRIDTVAEPSGDAKGFPDLLVYDDIRSQFFFVEVKALRKRLDSAQLRWQQRLDTSVATTPKQSVSMALLRFYCDCRRRAFCTGDLDS